MVISKNHADDAVNHSHYGNHKYLRAEGEVYIHTVVLIHMVDTHVESVMQSLFAIGSELDML